MSIRSVLKAYFNTGDKPTEAEFADFIDSDYNLDDDTSDNITEGSTNKFNATHSGDATGSGALTLTTVNSDVGTFNSAKVTVNAKGLIIAASNSEDVSTITPSGAVTIDFTTASFQKITLTSITTITINPNIPEGINTLVINEGTGYAVTKVTWGTPVDNNNDLTETASAKNIVQFINDGADISYITNTVGA